MQLTVVLFAFISALRANDFQFVISDSDVVAKKMAEGHVMPTVELEFPILETSDNLP